MDTLTLIPADALTGANPPTLGEYGRRLLAEGTPGSPSARSTRCAAATCC
jgi:hypothetical protein